MEILKLTNAYGQQFLNYYEQAGYRVETGVFVSSRVDSSVYLIGSTISTLKHFLFVEDIPRVVILQKAIRTQVLKEMESGLSHNSRYGSFFIAMGTLAPIGHLEETTTIALSYLKNIMHEDFQLKLRVNSLDRDLLNICKYECRNFNNTILETDTQPLSYYRHHYGLDSEGITGRNFNIAVDIGNDLCSDVGNIIVIEKNGIPFAVEFAMGISTLIAAMYGLEHTMLGNIVSDIFPMKNYKDYWLGDCISVVNCLQNEHVRPNSSHMQGRLLKRYKKVLYNLCENKKLNPDTLLECYGNYEKRLILPI